MKIRESMIERHDDNPEALLVTADITEVDI